jgi:hypothetical protein
VNKCAFDCLQTQILEYFHVDKHKGIGCMGYEPLARLKGLLDEKKKFILGKTMQYFPRV